MSETSIGTKVRKARESLGRSREQIAFAVGVSTSTVTRLENEDRIPNALALKRIADELGVSLDALLTPAAPVVTTSPSGAAGAFSRSGDAA